MIENDLLLDIIQNDFGIPVRRVCQVLLDKPNCSLDMLIRYLEQWHYDDTDTVCGEKGRPIKKSFVKQKDHHLKRKRKPSLNFREVRNALLLGIQYNIILYTETVPSQYKVDRGEVLFRLRHVVSLRCIQHIFSSRHANIYAAILRYGRLNVEKLLELCSDSKTRDEYVKAFHDLTSANFLCQKNQPVRIEKPIQKPKLPQRKRRRRDSEDLSLTMFSNLSEEKPEIQLKNEISVDRSVSFQVNRWEMNLHFIKNVLENALSERFSNNIRLIVRVLLNSFTIGTSKAYRFEQMSISQIHDDLVELVQKLVAGGRVFSKDPSETGNEVFEYSILQEEEYMELKRQQCAKSWHELGGDQRVFNNLLQWLGVLVRSEEFIVKVGDDLCLDKTTQRRKRKHEHMETSADYQISFYSIKELLHFSLFSSLVQTRYGRTSERVFNRIWLAGSEDEESRGMKDEKIAETVMVSIADCRRILNNLVTNRIIQFYDQKDDYIYIAEREEVRKYFLRDIQKAMLNLRVRRRFQKQVNRERIETCTDQKKILSNDRALRARRAVDILFQVEQKLDRSLLICRDL